jgi:hypothetical protein
MRYYLAESEKRQDNSTDFYRTWREYKEGFGDPTTSYWIVKMTSTEPGQNIRKDVETPPQITGL